jgi:hypothetical protein
MLNAFRSLPVFTKVVAIVLVYAALAAVAIALAPEEATLGPGIKTVYLHVALIWVGMVGIYVAGAIGLVVALTDRVDFAAWMRIIGLVAVAFYVGGSLASIAAQIINWGGLALSEPRTLSTLQVVAAGIIVMVLSLWQINRRLLGGIYLAWALFTFWATRSAALILHPDNPIGSSNSSAIQLTFYGMFGLTLLAAIALVAVLRPKTSASE